MLVLTRKENQSLLIGDNIRITVGQIHGNRVRILIDAPPEIAVVRDELWQATQPHRETACSAIDPSSSLAT